jgi:hypothetical protein
MRRNSKVAGSHGSQLAVPASTHRSDDAVSAPFYCQKSGVEHEKGVEKRGEFPPLLWSPGEPKRMETQPIKDKTKSSILLVALV